MHALQVENIVVCLSAAFFTSRSRKYKGGGVQMHVKGVQMHLHFLFSEVASVHFQVKIQLKI